MGFDFNPGGCTRPPTVFYFQSDKACECRNSPNVGDTGKYRPTYAVNPKRPVGLGRKLDCLPGMNSNLD